MSFHESAFEGAAPQRREGASPFAIGVTVFAGTLMIITGVFDAFQGLAAILEDDFFVVGNYVMSGFTWRKY